MKKLIATIRTDDKGLFWLIFGDFLPHLCTISGNGKEQEKSVIVS